MARSYDRLAFSMFHALAKQVAQRPGIAVEYPSFRHKYKLCRAFLERTPTKVDIVRAYECLIKQPELK